MPSYDLLFTSLIYALICLPFAFLMQMLVPQRYHSRKWLLFLFFYLLCFSMFILGMVIGFAFVATLITLKPPKERDESILRVTYPDYQQAPKKVYREYGEGSSYKFIATKQGSKDFRQQMLLAVNELSNKDTNAINRLALTDDSDEVRLYAQSLIEKQEKKLTNLAKNVLENLEKTENSTEAAYHKKQLAEILWEEVYKYLVSNETLLLFLEKIKTYAEEAFSVLTADVELPLLLSQVALRQNRWPEAKHWITKAENNHAPIYKICTFRAELAYHEKNYSEIPKILQANQDCGLLGLQPILKFWGQHA